MDVAGPRTVLIIDDHVLVARMLTEALRSRGYDARHCRSTSDETVLGAIRTFPPAVALLDLDLGDDRRGTRFIPALRDTGARVVILTGTNDRMQLAECVEAGADGFLPKTGSIDELVEAVEKISERGSLISDEQRRVLLAELTQLREERRAEQEAFDALTPREREILRALLDGKQAQAIADETFTSIRTVRGHIEGVLSKLGVNSQLAAVAKANEVGWTG